MEIVLLSFTVACMVGLACIQPSISMAVTYIGAAILYAGLLANAYNY